MQDAGVMRKGVKSRRYRIHFFLLRRLCSDRKALTTGNSPLPTCPSQDTDHTQAADPVGELRGVYHGSVLILTLNPSGFCYKHFLSFCILSRDSFKHRDFEVIWTSPVKISAVKAAKTKLFSQSCIPATLDLFHMDDSLLSVVQAQIQQRQGMWLLFCS